MKKNYYIPVLTLAVLMAAMPTMPAMAQKNDDGKKQEWKPQSFLTTEDLADETVFLPAPPEDGSAFFVNDALRYQWGKKLRSTPRGEQATKDAMWTTEYLFEYFAPAMGVHITKESMPETWKLLTYAINDGGASVRRGKKKYHRTRPYAYFNETTPVPQDEEALRHNGSYPSGHTARGWMCALVMTELNPDRKTEIIKAGFEYGQSRVIVGFHYQSDVDAARVASSAAFARLHADEGYLKQVEKARKEFSKIWKKIKD